MYIIFFGKSQDFTTCYYDRDNPIHDFDSVIKDFDLLESKVFTVDDIKNKEILSRYFFTIKGHNFCLLKLYSFAQAYSGSRIAGSIYGVGLLSESAINFTKDNLELLREAKDNFAKLSLGGVKFNKSNFQEDTDRIWKAIVNSNDGNLLDKVSTSSLKLNGSDGPSAFYVSDLLGEAIKLNDRISNQDDVYFSEDLEHLKRTQGKWGLDNFPVYWEQNNKFVPYKEPVQEQVVEEEKKEEEKKGGKKEDNNDIVKLRVELSDSQYNNRNIQIDLEKIKEKQKVFIYIIYGLTGLIVLLLLYIFFLGSSKNEVVKESPPKVDHVPQVLPQSDPISSFLIDKKTVDSGIVFLKSVQFIYSFDVEEAISDTSKFHKQFQNIEKAAVKYKIVIENVKDAYFSKCEDIKMGTTAKKNASSPKSAPKPIIQWQQKKSPN
jgi:hypothetical protein